MTTKRNSHAEIYTLWSLKTENITCLSPQIITRDVVVVIIR